MDGTLFEEWLHELDCKFKMQGRKVVMHELDRKFKMQGRKVVMHELDRKFKMQGRKVVMIVDNCLAYPDVS